MKLSKNTFNEWRILGFNTTQQGKKLKKQLKPDEKITEERSKKNPKNWLKK